MTDPVRLSPAEFALAVISLRDSDSAARIGDDYVWRVQWREADWYTAAPTLPRAIDRILRHIASTGRIGGTVPEADVVALMAPEIRSFARLTWADFRAVRGTVWSYTAGDLGCCPLAAWPSELTAGVLFRLAIL